MDKPYTRKRILVVENDPDLRDALEINLRMSGFQVAATANAEQALALAAAEVFDVAIVDKRLKNHASSADSSGFHLASCLQKSMLIILYTAYDDHENTKAAHSQLGDVAIVDKCMEGSGVEIIRAVETAYKKMQLNLDLTFQPAGLDLSGYAAGIELADTERLHPPTAIDLARIFQRLFVGVDSLSLNYLIPPEPPPSVSSSGTVLLRAVARRDGVYRTPEVVKLCARTEAETEAKNYRDYASYFNGKRIAILDHHSPVVSRSVGGLLYSLIDSDLEHNIISYRRFYQTAPVERIIRANRIFFEDTFGNLYHTARPCKIDLFGLYAPALHLTPEKLTTVMAHVLRPDRPGAPQIHFTAIRQPLPNPVAWAVSNGAFCQFDPQPVRCCIVHGDLHNRNILVDEAFVELPRFWLIDLARAGTSHNLRDFVELETDIKFTLLQSGNAQLWFELEAALLTPYAFGQPAPDLIFTDPEVSKAYRVINGLRRTAAELTQSDGGLLEYYQALFVHTLNAMRLRHISPNKKEHALLSAALLCQRLENWPEWEFEQRADLLPTAARLPVAAAAFQDEAPKSAASLRFDRALILLLILAGGTIALVSLLYAAGQSEIGGFQWAAILLGLFLLLVSGLAVAGLISPEQTAGLLRAFLDRVGRQMLPPRSRKDTSYESDNPNGPTA
jgi:CheY-like chemotaxis protein